MLNPEIVRLPVGDDPPTARLYYGKTALDMLRGLPDDSVHMACCSPPYWGHRNYGVEPQAWPEVRYRPVAGVSEVVVPAQQVALGLEGDLLHYVGHLVAVFREVRRVVRGDGTLWLNLGDGYVGTPRGSAVAGNLTNSKIGSPVEDARFEGAQLDKSRSSGLASKNLAGTPWRLALALQADGWFLRNDVIWSKSAVMPEPVKDRCSKSHEYIFMLSPSPVYYFDSQAIREEGSTGAGRNRRTVWNVNPRPFPGAHFAVWPPELVGLMIKAGTSEHGACQDCKAPWRRVIEHGAVLSTGGSSKGARASNMDQVSPLGQDPKCGAYNTGDMVQREHLTVGWEPTCDCGAEVGRSVVLDPFSGSGTTGMVALNLGHDYIGIDLNADYLPMAKARILGEEPPGEAEIEDGDVFDLFGVTS